MATRAWLGRAKAVAQITTATPGGTIGTETFTLTINGKAISYTAQGGDTVALVVDGLLAAWEAADDDFAEFADATPTDSTTTLTLTGAVAGVPFTVTGSATGSATLTVSTTTACTGPNYWTNTANWSGGAVPVNADDVIIDVPVSILYGLDQSAVTLASLVVGSSFTGDAYIGLPRTNPAGYTEYRDQYLAIGATAVRIGVGDGNGSARIKIAFGSVQTSCEVRRASQGAETNVPAVLLTGTHASNAFDVQEASVGLAFYGGETATALTLRLAAAAQVTCGEGATLGTITGEGSLSVNSSVTTLTQYDGEWRVNGAAAVTTFTQHGGVLQHRSTGTFATSTIGGTLERSERAAAATMTTATLNPGGRIVDPAATLTFTNGVARGTRVRELSAI